MGVLNFRREWLSSKWKKLRLEGSRRSVRMEMWCVLC